MKSCLLDKWEVPSSWTGDLNVTSNEADKNYVKYL